jgi:hypothetical protein
MRPSPRVLFVGSVPLSWHRACFSVRRSPRKSDAAVGTTNLGSLNARCGTPVMHSKPCGFGRRKPETIPELLHIHAMAAEMA